MSHAITLDWDVVERQRRRAEAGQMAQADASVRNTKRAQEKR